MASYTELFDIAINNALLDKFTAAVAIQAEAIRTESDLTVNHANRLRWSKEAFSDPRAMASKMTWAILAQNADRTKASILSATDASILAAVAAAVDVFATGS
jgi:hypothetical protein